jgi:uncharacterized membrane protein
MWLISTLQFLIAVLGLILLIVGFVLWNLSSSAKILVGVGLFLLLQFAIFTIFKIWKEQKEEKKRNAAITALKGDSMT